MGRPIRTERSRMADALAKRDAKRYPFPADLFEAAGIRRGGSSMRR